MSGGLFLGWAFTAEPELSLPAPTPAQAPTPLAAHGRRVGQQLGSLVSNEIEHSPRSRVHEGVLPDHDGGNGLVASGD
jgi:hypothetical protein